MWGDVGRCGEMWGDVGRCGEVMRRLSSLSPKMERSQRTMSGRICSSFRLASRYLKRSSGLRHSEIALRTYTGIRGDVRRYREDAGRWAIGCGNRGGQSVGAIGLGNRAGQSIGAIGRGDRAGQSGGREMWGDAGRCGAMGLLRTVLPRAATCAPSRPSSAPSASYSSASSLVRARARARVRARARARVRARSSASTWRA